MATSQHIFARFATTVSEWAGKPLAFILALAAVIVWAGLGPVFDYSETWQLVINTGTTIVTFLMVFLLQNEQTRDTRAIQAKLDEIILTSHAENKFIGIEHLDEEDLEHLDRLVAKAAKGQREALAAKLDISKREKTRRPGAPKATAPKPRKPKRKTAPQRAPSKV
ncbi:low affinity iron permease family protein [Rhizobium sp. S152]|uniref:low affinity iron permease family protein n=1 Tax=Rhizobium sp. S152 TaxID=3055038 RepID=UPI0025A998FD|nr:low affinity iron permease family protein [Rhizobium sp. S152]MDM9628219.1 low affinity iron permease family protein [Rhizobium sp. S152]